MFPISSAIVLPDSPSADELRAAMTISAAFGRMSTGRMSLTLLSQSQVTPEIQSSYHLIFVGKPAALSMLSAIKWPATLAGNAINSAGMQADDGILQMANSPWNPGRMLLWVGGNTDAGVLKAAQALSSGDLKPLLERDKVIIADIQPFVTAPVEESLKIPPDRKFSDLGYDIRKVDGVGFKQLDYIFYLSPGLVPSEKPYIDLAFNNSSLLDPSTSSMVVYVNGVQIASERLSEDTSVLTTKRILIPENLVRMGENLISVQANLFPITACSLFTFNSLWLTIYPESVLHLPL
ncbi:MAG: cellulose biosynthesis cyclic di-GMP-binding regulatory protein BcsB, partial [Anaerolineae bacterium]